VLFCTDLTLVILILILIHFAGRRMSVILRPTDKKTRSDSADTTADDRRYAEDFACGRGQGRKRVGILFPECQCVDSTATDLTFIALYCAVQTHWQLVEWKLQSAVGSHGA